MVIGLPIMNPGLLISLGQVPRGAVGDYHFIGTEASVVWKGYIEGAVRSDIRGAEEVVMALGKTQLGQSKPWELRL